MDKSPLCMIHNQPAIFYDNNPQSELQFLCKLCIKRRLKLSLIEEFLEPQSKILYNAEKRELSLKLFEDLTETLNAYKKNIITAIDDLSNTLNYQCKIIDQQSNFQTNQANIETINKKQKNIIEILKNQLTLLVEASKTNNFFSILNKYCLQINLNNDSNQTKENESQIGQIDGIQSKMIIDKKLDFQLMQQLSYKQNEICYAIAFNKDNSIIIAGCKQFIKVFDFKDEIISEIQQLNGDTDVAVLYFMKKSNQFISANYDINIWKLNQDNQWQNNQFLKAHSNYVRCIVMNQNEDVLISGSGDKTMKFWNKQNNIWSCIQIIDCQSDVWSISLSNQEDKLISSVNDKLILVIHLEGKEWIIKQKISVEQYGYRICYINNDQFLFQPFDRQYLLIFDNDQKDQTFKKGQELQYQSKAFDNYCLFPIRYIPQTGLIIVKNDHHVHLIKKSQNGQFTVESSINFNTYSLFGGITDDGRYMATWDNKSKEIQIRKFEY